MKRTILAVFAATLIMTIKPAIAQSTWTIDPAHSAAQFQVKHLMISTVRGEFGKMSGRITFDGKNYSTVKAEAVIEAASINTREPKRDDHLRSSDFFDTASHPTITFKSKHVEGTSGNKFNLVGDLTIRGVTKEVTLNVEATPIAKGMRGELRIGAQATTRLNRQDYGVKWNQALDAGGVVVGNEVQIIIDLELIQTQTGKVMQDSEVNSGVFFFRTISSVKVFVHFSSPKGGENLKTRISKNCGTGRFGELAAAFKNGSLAECSKS